MGSLRRKTTTRALPDGAELFERKGRQFARWIDGRRKKQTAKVTTGKDGSLRVVIEAATYTAKFRDADGIIQEVATGCRDKDAARAVLAYLERRVELIQSKVLSPDEAAVADSQGHPFAEQLNAYIRSLKAAGRSRRHVTDTERLATQLAVDCGFKKLGDIQAERVETWLASKLDAGMAARTRNSYLQALSGFCAWCTAIESSPSTRCEMFRRPTRSQRQPAASSVDQHGNRAVAVCRLLKPPSNSVGEHHREASSERKVTATKPDWLRSTRSKAVSRASVERL